MESLIKTKSYFLFILISSIILSSCEDPIEIDLQTGKGELCVDAMLTNDPGKQIIKLRITDNYFKQGLPPAKGAEVKVTDFVGRVFQFTDSDNNGDYEWVPGPSDIFPFGIMGNAYVLNIKFEGQEYEAFSVMDSIQPIDSLFYEFREQEIVAGDTIKEGYVLNMFAKDKKGKANAYWFKSYRNGKFFSKPGDMNLAYDAAFGPGSDGVQFITPIIFNLSPERFSLNDTALVEIYSIGLPTFYYMSLAQQQMTNTGLFATPATNVPTNIQNKNKDSKIKAVGWFCTASITRKGVRIK